MGVLRPSLVKWGFLLWITWANERVQNERSLRPESWSDVFLGWCRKYGLQSRSYTFARAHKRYLCILFDCFWVPKDAGMIFFFCRDLSVRACFKAALHTIWALSTWDFWALIVLHNRLSRNSHRSQTPHVLLFVFVGGCLLLLLHDWPCRFCLSFRDGQDYERLVRLRILTCHLLGVTRQAKADHTWGQ